MCVSFWLLLVLVLVFTFESLNPIFRVMQEMNHFLFVHSFQYYFSIWIRLREYRICFACQQILLKDARYFTNGHCYAIEFQNFINIYIRLVNCILHDIAWFASLNIPYRISVVNNLLLYVEYLCFMLNSTLYIYIELTNLIFIFNFDLILTKWQKGRIK